VDERETVELGLRVGDDDELGLRVGDGDELGLVLCVRAGNELGLRVGVAGDAGAGVLGGGAGVGVD